MESHALSSTCLRRSLACLKVLMDADPNLTPSDFSLFIHNYGQGSVEISVEVFHELLQVGGIHLSFVETRTEGLLPYIAVVSFGVEAGNFAIENAIPNVVIDTTPSDIFNTMAIRQLSGTIATVINQVSLGLGGPSVNLLTPVDDQDDPDAIARPYLQSLYEAFYQDEPDPVATATAKVDEIYAVLIAEEGG